MRLRATIDAAEFAALMALLGPWGQGRSVAVACSGGADSLALTVLTSGWAETFGHSVLALIVDHGLRPDSDAEARLTQTRLAKRGIASRILTLHNVRRTAAAARAARYAALNQACAEAGLTDLLLGHHRSDQAETRKLREQAGSGADGLAGMAAIVTQPGLRLLRPLLPLPPGRLRATLQACGLDWVEDPSNQDQRAQRARVRAVLAADPAAAHDLAEAAAQAGRARQATDAAVAAELAARAVIHPAGFAVLNGTVSARALSALLRCMGGHEYPPAPASVAALAADLRPATLAGCRILPAGRLGGQWLVQREEAAMQPPVPAIAGAVWDNRFRLVDAWPGCTLGGLGNAAPELRQSPSSVLRTMPALFRGGAVVSVPHLDGGAVLLPANPVPACPSFIIP